MSDSYVQLHLTCASRAEADKIANALLVKQLISCAKVSPVESAFRWQGKIEQADEHLLIMDSRLDLFDQAEAAIKAMHCYDTFVLAAVPVLKVSKKAGAWLSEELKNV